MRILIIEDDEASRKLMGMLLSKYGECVFAENGKIAYEKFKEDFKKSLRFDLLLLDIMMPEMDGQETLKHIKEFEKENGVWPNEGAKVIMTTALSGTDYVQNAFALGCEGYASKPIDTEKFVVVMKNLGLIHEEDNIPSE